MVEETDKAYKFKKLIKQLEKYKGSGTELISVYIPAGYPIHETTGKLREELSQAANIKSKSTKNNVSDALEKILNHLKMYRKTPEKGVCIFSGNISESPSKTDVELFSLEPMYELKMNIYRCDSRFFLDPLKNMVEAKDAYGIVVMDGKDATIAIIKGTEIRIIKKLHSTAHSKIRKGGQSAARFQRLIEEQIEKYHRRIGEAMDTAFLNKGLKGVIIGGPGPTKEFFMKGKNYNYQINVLGVVNTGYTDEYGVREVLNHSEEILAEQDTIKEKKLVDRFVKNIVKGGLATYGLNEVTTAIKTKKASHVLVSEKLSYRRILHKCNECSIEEDEIIAESAKLQTKKCTTCNNNMQIEEDETLTDYFIELATENKIKIDVISADSSEGVQFLQGFGGIGAFLRYK